MPERLSRCYVEGTNKLVLNDNMRDTSCITNENLGEGMQVKNPNT